MTRRYGRAPRGERVVDTAPAGDWRTLTLLGAISWQGMLASMIIESPTDGDVFLAYLEQILCPKLQPGHVVVMDNLGAHKVAGVRELIEARGAQLLYLPPYSPDFNPIEKAWSKIKHSNRRLLRPSQLSPRTTPQHGSNTADTVYSFMGTALALPAASERS